MLNINNKETLIIAAFRYSLGRNTYIVESVVNDIINNINNIDNNSLMRMKKEIEEAIENNNIGMDIDKNYWLKLINIIDNKIKKGKK